MKGGSVYSWFTIAVVDVVTVQSQLCHIRGGRRVFACQSYFTYSLYLKLAMFAVLVFATVSGVAAGSPLVR